MGWQAFEGDAIVRGIRLKGDPKVPWTRLWNRRFLMIFRSKEVTILEPAGITDSSLTVGFITFHGRAQVRSKPVMKWRFAVRHGREDCTFFALSVRTGLEVPLRIVERTTVDRLPPGVERV